MPAAPAAFAVAHRGLSGEAPENTLAAFRLAAEAGFPAVELDVRCTKDGVPVVLHDAALGRTMRVAGRVERMTWTEVRAATNEEVPRLEDVVGELGTKLHWDIEVKEPQAADPTVALIRRLRLSNRTVLTAMNPVTLATARKADPTLRLGLIAIGELDRADIGAATEVGATWLMADHDYMDAQRAQFVQESGLRLGVWTVNEPTRARQMVDLGATCIITDMRRVNDILPGRPLW